MPLPHPRSWLPLLFCLFTGVAAGQTLPSNLRDTTVAVNPAGQLIDTLTVAPGSLVVDGMVPGDYALSGRFLRWRTVDLPDSVRLRYRVLPFQLDARVRLLDSTLLQREEAGLVIGGYTEGGGTGLFRNDSRVRTQGSFSRAISFGNRQDLVLNSAFNLQLDGELGNGIEVAAAITDESLPVQPEGTTQQLREFDRIFIQLRKGGTQLTAGDYELRHPDGYFLRFFKKLEGATITSVVGLGTRDGVLGDPSKPGAEGGVKKSNGGDGRSPLGRNTFGGNRTGGTVELEDGATLTNHASIAIARGQFTRQQIQPIEGNQGPYKLTGEGNASRFLIVLAGTERIFLDGVQLQRGLDADYIIDYNLAELTFTTRRLITRDSRITAEYEFADQRYVRTLATGGTRYDSGRFSAYVNGYTQQDSRTATGDLDLSLNQREQLSRAGDAMGGIPILSVDSLDTRSEVRATYTALDTTLRTCVRAPIDTFFLVADIDGPLVATFTDRGPNGGEYELDPERPANENVYRYVGTDPVTCQPRGRFAPVIDLVAPQQQQLLAVGGEYRFKDGGGLRIEGAASNLNLNRFSREDSEDDAGNALRVDADRRIRLGSDSSDWSLGTAAHFEYVAATFNAINPYRSPEFYRDWNLSNRLATVQPGAAIERILGGGLSLNHGGYGNLTYSLEQFSRGTTYLGTRHAGEVQFRAAGWRVTGQASLLDSRDSAGEGSLRRPSLAVSKQLESLGGWTVEGKYEGERSVRQQTAVDTLAPFSFQFDRYAVGLRSPANDKYKLALGANRRTDRLPRAESLTLSTEATEVSAEGNYTAGENLQFGGNFTFRDLNVVARDLVEDVPDRTFLGRLDLRASALKRSVRSQTTYQVGSGQEPRVDFQYLFVGAGQGQYIWQDSLYNNDGKIQPNEMELAPFSDIGDYVRVSVFTNDFIRSNNVALNQKLNWDPTRLWKERGGIRKFLRRFTVNNSVIIDRKTREGEDIQGWNPLQLAVADSSLVALNLSRRHGLFFNRQNPKYDLQIANSDRRNRRVLTTGYEASRDRSWVLRGRYRPTRNLSLELAGTVGERSADSEFFNNKDYELDRWSVEPSVNWQPGDWRFITRLVLSEQENVLKAGMGEGTSNLELQLEGNLNQWLTASFRWVDVTFTGESRSPVGFALLQGLQPGRNLLWNLGVTRPLGEYLQMTISYDGRQTGEANTVHVGRAQVQAFF